VWKESNWEKERTESVRNHGQDYIGHKGEKKESVKAYEHNCRYKCSDNFTGNLKKKYFLISGTWVFRTFRPLFLTNVLSHILQGSNPKLLLNHERPAVQC
jgi:hypothetical protein